MHTLEEIKERLAETIDEVEILEILNINSFDLVEAFADRIEEKASVLETEIFDDDNDDDQENPSET